MGEEIGYACRKLPSHARRFILAPYGSAGDVFPFLWLGKELKRQNYEVILVASAVFAKAVRAEGLHFIPVGTEEEYHQMACDPDLWHPLKGPWKVLSAVKQWFPLLTQILEKVSRKPGSVFLASAPNLPATYVARRYHRPLITVHLQPLMLFSVENTPVLLNGLAWVSTLPKWLKKCARQSSSPADWMLRSMLQKACIEGGLPLPKRLLLEWWNSPDGVLCLFPQWFAPPQSDWPQRLRQTGFPLFDIPSPKDNDAQLRDFLAAGSPPLLFTAGSAMGCSAKFFQAALEACIELDTRAVFISAYPDQLPPALPPSICHVRYASFTKLFPAGAVIIHHGGIGTTAQALAAGVPQVIVSMSHDQPDHGARIEHLGVGKNLPYFWMTGKKLTTILRLILSTPSFRERAQALRATNELRADVTETVAAIQSLLDA